MDPGYSLADAQRDKLDLICRKLGLKPGDRLLDIGCGWGSLSLHAAQHYGARVVGVTLSREQQDFVLARVAERGLDGQVEIRLQDYREVPTASAERGGFDAVTSIEMGEHVGAENYPTFAGVLHAAVREGGRVLVQQMSRRDRPGGGAFIESYIAPDMHMRPVGETIALLENSGLEVRDVHAMREHYVWTVRAWLETFEKNWDAVVALVGEEIARVWRLYLVGAALVFEEGRMGVDQILAVKRSASGVSGLPPVRDDGFLGVPIAV
jgi:cyclopropane-fatty-acyl-phospholipid synthase